MSRYQQADLLVRALGEVGDGRPHHEGEEELVARMQASTAWEAPSCRRGEQEAEGGSPHGAGRPGEVPHGEKSGRWRHRLSCCEGGGRQTADLGPASLAEEGWRRGKVVVLDHLGSRPFVLHTNHRDPLVLSQEKKGGKEVSVWDLDQNGQFICLLGQNISMMSTKQTI